MTTPLTAWDEITVAVQTAWDAGASTSALPLAYEDVAFDPPTDGSGWGRVSWAHVVGGQVTVGSSNGSSRHRKRGVVMVELYAPDDDGLQTLLAMVEVVMGALEGTKTAGVWFSNARPQKVKPEPPWSRRNVIADFRYDQVRS